MQGLLEKMHTQHTQPISYQLVLGENSLALNPLLGKQLTLEYSGKIICRHCESPTKKSFNQGYCYRCFTKLAQCDLCIMKPETCHFAKGTCREPDWAKDFCFQAHIVYLANSSGLKVGITRQTQIPTRWIDQGATQALPIFQTRSRYLAGLVEVMIAQHVSDKTNWQKMLKQAAVDLDLIQEAARLLDLCKTELTALRQQMGEENLVFLKEAKVVTIEFPVVRYPIKINSFNLDNVNSITGVLEGIKGQYLLLDSGVINLRKFTGYEIKLTVN